MSIKVTRASTLEKLGNIADMTYRIAVEKCDDDPQMAADFFAASASACDSILNYLVGSGEDEYDEYVEIDESDD